MVDLYIIVYNALTNNPGTTGHGRDGYYFGITGEYSWYELSKEISRTLVELGVHKESEPDSFTRDELLKYFGSPVSVRISSRRLGRRLIRVTRRTGNWPVFWHELSRCSEALKISWMEPQEGDTRYAC